MSKRSFPIHTVVALSLTASPAMADGIVAKIVSSPLTAVSTVQGARLSINVYLQNKIAPGIAFMDPAVIGYGIPAGGRIEVELGGGFKRDPAIQLNATGIILVTGAPQQGLPSKKLGYTVLEASGNTFAIEPIAPGGIRAQDMISPTPGASRDPIRQRGIKVFHIGLRARPFINKGKRGTVEVWFVDANGKIIERGRGEIAFLESPIPQIYPTNLMDNRRNHNWQRIPSGETLGKKPGTLPMSLLMFERAIGVPTQHLDKFNLGTRGASVLSSDQLTALGYARPKSLARYTAGLILKDTNRDGRLDPSVDKIIGGVLDSAPSGSAGHEIRTLDFEGQPVLSELLSNIMPKVGSRIGGGVMVLQFTGGDKPGFYQPTLALLKDPDDLNSPDGSSYTYTIVVE